MENNGKIVFQTTNREESAMTVPANVDIDGLLTRMRDLHKQATTEQTHYYTAAVLQEAIAAIEHLCSIPVIVPGLDVASEGTRKAVDLLIRMDWPLLERQQAQLDAVAHGDLVGVSGLLEHMIDLNNRFRYGRIDT